MDIIGHCLAIAPVPYLSLSWTIFQFIWTTIQEAQSSKQQLHALAESIAQLLQTLDAEIRAGRLIPEKTSDELDNLCQILEEISAFVKVQSSYSFLKVLYKKDDRVATIEQYHRRISATVTAFQISSLLNVRDWQTRHDAARAADQQDLVEHLSRLEKNQKELAKALNAQQNNMVAIMASLQKSILQQIGTESERRFYSQSLRFLATTSGHHVQLENWMITSFEVDFGPEIGSGGFGHVYKGTWNKTDVALKVLKTDAGVMPSLAAIRREVKTWSRLHHPHILQFLGANILDDRPFILMPYLKNGNARDYIHEHPECDRLQILYHISLGLVYLHSNNVIHGDLKALNVLIDDGGRGVLCDFGLSRMKADATSRSAVPGQGIAIGSRNWMAPERIKGGGPRKASDIYAFGMTIYEIITLEIPLGHIGYDEFAKLVVDEDVRPERPYDDEAPDMSDDLWDLAEQCWRRDPLCRPSASIVSDDIRSFFHGVKSPAVSNPPVLSPSPNSPTPNSPTTDLSPRPVVIFAPEPERRSRSRSRSSSPYSTRSRSPRRRRRHRRSRTPPGPVYISPTQPGYQPPIIIGPSRSPTYDYPPPQLQPQVQVIPPSIGYEDNVFFEFKKDSMAGMVLEYDSDSLRGRSNTVMFSARIVIKLWDDRARKTAETFRQNANNGKVGPYSFAKYSFAKTMQLVAAETYDTQLFAAFDEELDPNFVQGGFGPSIVAISRPVSKWWISGEKPSNTLAIFLTGMRRGDKRRKWLPFGEIISGLEGLKALGNGDGVHITNCGTVSSDEIGGSFY